MVNSYIQEPTRNEKLAVTTATVEIAAPRNAINPRKVITIRNTSPNGADVITINLGYEGSVVAGAGIVLQQNEGFTDSSEAGYECWQGTIRAVCATANGVLSIFER